MAGYSGTPLATKLGIKAGSKVALIGAPNGYRQNPLSIAIRWLCAGALLVPIRYTGEVALQQFKVYPGAFFSVATFAVAALLTAGLMAAIVILLRPSAHRDRSLAA